MYLVTVLCLTLSILKYGECNVIHDGTGTEASSNQTDPDKDMYVIRATVYQIGILTNKTNETAQLNPNGNQESLTLYHNNGTNVDLSQISEPFLTNITAQTYVGVAPIQHDNVSEEGNAWDALNKLRHPEKTVEGSESTNQDPSMQKRSLDYSDFFGRLFKRDTSVKMINGTALIPPEAGVQSISLPPLLSLNNKLTDIPVPIPNTSVVHYAKVNTLVRKP